MSIYLGIHRIALFWIWTVSEDIFGWTYLYLYLNQCICICIWINVEQNICICICIWKIQIFVFVFVFVFDKTYLTPALIGTLIQVQVGRIKKYTYMAFGGSQHGVIGWLHIKTWPSPLICRPLTHWGQDKMDAISQTTFSSVFSLMKTFEFRLKFHWSLFLRVQSTIFQHWFR